MTLIMILDELEDHLDLGEDSEPTNFSAEVLYYELLIPLTTRFPGKLFKTDVSEKFVYVFYSLVDEETEERYTLSLPIAYLTLDRYVHKDQKGLEQTVKELEKIRTRNSFGGTPDNIQVEKLLKKICVYGQIDKRAFHPAEYAWDYVQLAIANNLKRTKEVLGYMPKKLQQVIPRKILGSPEVMGLRDWFKSRDSASLSMLPYSESTAFSRFFNQRVVLFDGDPETYRSKVLERALKLGLEDLGSPSFVITKD